MREAHDDHHLFADLVLEAVDALLVLDANGCIRLLNPAAERLLARPADELLGEAFGFPLKPGADTDLTLPTPAGTRVAQMRALRVPWNGQPGWLVTLQDVTELRRAQQDLSRHARDLERSNRDLEEFAGTIAHDLRQPLRTVRGFAELLLLHHADRLDGEPRALAERIVDGADRLGGMIDDVLRYARLGAGGLQVSPVGSADVVREVVAMLDESVRERGATVTVGDLPEVHADRALLSQLFQNLIGNALKFGAPERPLEIAIAAGRDEDEWRFTVSDNGRGIEAGALDEVFRMFRRAPSARDTDGTGMGLALCRRIVERHGGRIGVESEPGAGTRVHFTLPVDPPESPGAGA